MTRLEQVVKEVSTTGEEVGMPTATTVDKQNKLYETYIAKSRYARYLDPVKRRENWSETVARYIEFMDAHLLAKHNYTIPAETRAEIVSAIENFEVMPSMRSLMTAGKALNRDNTCGYNCSYLPIDDPKAFDEAMYILLAGTGVGFSVERQYVNKLPEIPEKVYDSETTIVVSDSKEGWAKALRQVLAMLYAGEAPQWDVSKVRPAGARLKTFGGRASGPEPLVELFKFAVKTFKAAAGRKLNSLECHDIMCKIGEVVVVGGVRRSAMISLSNLSDDRLRHAKAGAWYETQGQRALANNSACYTERPDVGTFLREWLSLYDSKSGERGIFNREAAKNVVKMNGRRNPDFDFGTNPCSEIILRPYQFCNLTEIIVRSDDTVESIKRKARIAAIMGTYQSTLTHFPYLRKIWKDNTEQERLLGVSMTGILDNANFNNPDDKDLPARLEAIKAHCVAVNLEFSEILGIQQSTAITAVKPSGTVSQLVDSASGLHPRHAVYYFRRVRADNKDPLTKFMIESGIPHEPDVTKPNHTTIFTFPKKAPHGALLREQLTAIQHLKLWLVYQRHYCEHKPSVTISVSEKEWPAVGAFVWEHFDEMSGVSFLPYDGGSYKQAPYEDCTEKQYNELMDKMPTDPDWDSIIEIEDNVEGAQMLACTAGGCEI
jgi:ribonucleoside-diphosphate reductase alpha chain